MLPTTPLLTCSITDQLAFDCDLACDLACDLVFDLR